MSRRKKSTRKKPVPNKNLIVHDKKLSNVGSEISLKEDSNKNIINNDEKINESNFGKEIVESDNFENAIKTMNPFFSFSILFAVVAVCFFFINLFVVTKLLDFAIGYKTFVLLICSYYLVIYLFNRKMENIISLCIFNFMGMIALYNILMHFNLFQSPLLSQTYFVPNILYFYMAFLIASYSYKIYDFFAFLGLLILSLIDGLTKTPIKSFAIISIIYFIFSYTIIWIAVFSKNLSISFLYENIFLISIIIAVLLAIISKYNVELLTKVYKKTVYFESKYRLKERIDGKTEYILKLFEMSKIPNLKLLNKDKKLLIPTSIFYILIKIIMPLWIVMYYSAGFQYFYYYESNNNYCVNLDKDDEIIKLYNGNVITHVLRNFQEVNCEKEKIHVELSIKKRIDDMIEKSKAH